MPVKRPALFRALCYSLETGTFTAHIQPLLFCFLLFFLGGAVRKENKPSSIKMNKVIADADNDCCEGQNKEVL